MSFEHTINPREKNATPFSRAIIISWAICGLGALFYCYEYLLRVSPSVMTQELMRFYHLTGEQYGNLSGSFYYYSYVAMQIVVGLLMDRYGPKRLLTLACLMCAIGAYLFGCSDKVLIAMLGRFLIGMGSAFAFVGAAKLATIWLPPKRFALVSGIIFCLGMVGAMSGQIVMGFFVQSSGWQVTIFGASAVGLVLAAILWIAIEDVNPYHKEHYSHHMPTLQEVLTGLGKALKNSQIWLAGSIGCLLYLFLSAFAELWGPSYLEEAHNMARTHAVDANAMIFLGCAMGAPLWGWFSDLLEERKLPMKLAATGALLVFCLLLYVHHLPLPLVYVLLFLFGFLSSVQILVFAIAREVTPIEISGTTIGLLNMLVMVGGVIFPPIVGKLLDMNWQGTMIDGARVYSEHAYTVALSVLPLGILVGILLLFLIRETHCKVYSEKLSELVENNFSLVAKRKARR